MLQKIVYNENEKSEINKLWVTDFFSTTLTLDFIVSAIQAEL